MQTAGQHNREELATAFEAFNELSLQLESSYRALEERVAGLNEELAAARSERLLQLAEKERLAERLEKLLDALPGGVIVLDGDSFIRECNPAARELLGEPLIGAHWHTVTARAFAPGEGEGGEVRLHDHRRINISTRRLDAEPGRILLLHDVTETRELQETVSRQQRLSSMGEMAASLAHQIRTPLSAALLYASQLAKGRVGLADTTRFAEKLRARLKHLERMVNDMLIFARGGCTADEEIEVSSLLDELMQTMEPQMQAGDACWDVRDECASAVIHGNKQALLGALLNLATNSLQASGNNACLRLRAGLREQGVVEISLSDNGPGIPAQARERIFEPFFTTRPDGTGLGLAVVQAVVRAHRGDIALHSAAGEGACFVMRFPPAALQGVLSTGEAGVTREAASAAGDDASRVA